MYNSRFVQPFTALKTQNGQIYRRCMRRTAMSIRRFLQCKHSKYRGLEKEAGVHAGLTSLDVFELSLGLVSLLRQPVAL